MISPSTQPTAKWTAPSTEDGCITAGHTDAEADILAFRVHQQDAITGMRIEFDASHVDMWSKLSRDWRVEIPEAAIQME
jgi:hypothetical protein